MSKISEVFQSVFKKNFKRDILPDDRFYEEAEKRGHYTTINGEKVLTERGEGYREGIFDSLEAYGRNPEQFQKMAAMHAIFTKLRVGSDIDDDISGLN